MAIRRDTPLTAGTVRIGISGWRYAPWRGAFYPEGLRQADELAFAAAHFDSIEINGSFYSLQRPESYQAWYDATPTSFVFAVKASRYITHLKRLQETSLACANFWASGVLRLEQKLGPILWQLPPNLAFDDRLEPFLSALPRSTRDASLLASKHDARVIHPSFEVDIDRPIRHALEVRHASFCTPAFVALLRRHNVALVIADSAKRFPFLEDITADFVYIRLHGDQEIYRSGYSAQAITRWASRIREFRNGRQPAAAARVSRRPPARRTARDVYVYFDNDIKVRAPFDARALMTAVGHSSSSALVRKVEGPLSPVSPRR
jgi:uncharacterized protein YecE (DUF72 family)